MLANLRALFGVVIDIVILRRGPEHLPVSQGLLIVAAILSTLATTLLGTALAVAPLLSLIMAAIASLVMALWFRFLLTMANKRERFVQMQTALFLISAIFVALLIPVIPSLLPYMETPDPANPPPSGPLFIGAAICFWALLLEVRIVRAAFECHWLVAIMVLVSEIFVANIVTVILLGGAGKPA
jgi:hypothetical protein